MPGTSGSLGWPFVVGAVLFADMLGRDAEHRTLQETLFSWVPVAGLHYGYLVEMDAIAALRGS